MIVSDLNKFEDPPMPADGEKHGLCRRSDRGWRLKPGSRDDWHWKGPGCGLSGSTMTWGKSWRETTGRGGRNGGLRDGPMGRKEIRCMWAPAGVISGSTGWT